MNGLIPSNPQDMIVRTEQDLPPHISFAQFQTIHQGLAGDMRSQILCALLWDTGGRINDVMNMRWKDLDLDDGLLNLFVDKRNDVITISLGQDLIGELKNYRSVVHPAADDYLFPSVFRVGHVSRQAAYLKVTIWGNKFLGMPLKPPGNLHPHMFRHGLAIYLMYHAEMGGDMQGRAKIIAARLGHRNTQITLNTYLVVTPDVQRAAMKNVPMR